MQVKPFKFGAILICSMFISTNSNALSLEDVIEQALESSDQIKNIYDKKKVGESEIDEYVGYTLPNISFSTSANYVDNSAKSQASAFGLSDLSSLTGGEPGPNRLAGMNYDWALTANQTLNIFRIGVTRDIADNQANVLSYTEQLEKENFVSQVVEMFNSTLTSQEDLKVAEQTVLMREKLLDFVQIESQSGRLNSIELRKVEVGLAMAKADVDQLKSVALERKKALGELLKREINEELEMKDSDVLSLQIKSVNRQNPYSLKVLQESNKLLVNNVKYQNSMFYPSLDLIARVNNQLLGYDSQKWSVLDKYFDPDYFNYSIGIKLTWNIFSGGTITAKYDQLRIQSRIKEREFNLQKETLDRNIDLLQGRLSSAEKYFETSKEYYEVLKLSYEKDHLDYQSGLLRLSDLTTSEKEFKDAYRNSIKARSNYIAILIQYRVLLGMGIYGGNRE